MIRRTLLAGLALAALTAAGGASAASSSTTSPAPATTTATPPATTTPPAATTTPSPPSTATSTTPTTGQFATEADAKSNCGSDLVVWANKHSHVYHYSGTKLYGKGPASTHAYMCQKDADSSGFHAAKNETAPTK